MLWVLFLALTVWIFFQERRLERLALEVSILKATRPEPLATPRPPPEAFEAPPREPPPPPPSNALSFSPPPRVPEAAAAPLAAAEPEPLWVQYRRSASMAREADREPGPRISLEAWLSQNGLAWIGGGALAIGGALLVGFAAQQGLFTPIVRIVMAALLGAGLVASGELMRRGRLGRLGDHPLAAAIATGAGASVLFGAAWAAHGLYHFYSAGVCAALLALVAGGLLGLALKRGQALSLLALGGAFIAPLVAASGGWAEPVVVVYLGLLIAVGMTVGAERRWTAATGVTLAGAGLWAALGALEQSTVKMLLLGLEPLAIAALLPKVRPTAGVKVLAVPTVVFASVLTFLALFTQLRLETPVALAWGGFAAVALIGLTALQNRRRLAHGALLAAPALALFLLAAIGLQTRTPTMGGALPMLWLGQAALLTLAGAWAVWPLRERMAASIAAVAGAVLMALTAGAWSGPGNAGALAMLLAALMLSAAAILLSQARGARDDGDSREVWIGGAALSFVGAVAMAATPTIAPLAFAAVAVLLALLHARIGARVLGGGAASAAAIGFGALLGPDMFALAFRDALGAGCYLASALVVAGAAYAASRLTRPRSAGLAEAFLTLTPVSVLTGVFVSLRWAAEANPGLPLDHLTEASLRTLLLAAGGLSALTQLRADSGFMSRLRVHGLLLAGMFHALFMQVMLFNPWWGAGSHAVAGPPLLDTLTIGFLAPGLLLALASRRGYRLSKPQGRSYLIGAAGLLMMWAILEIRRVTHPADLSGGLWTVGPLESAAYALLWLGAALGVTRLRGEGPLSADMARADEGLRWFAGGHALAILILWSAPWWGAGARAFNGAGEAVATWGLWALVIAALAKVAADARRARRLVLGDVAETGAAVLGLALLTLLIRWLYRGDSLIPGQPHLSAEIWSYSAAWAVAGLALLAAPRKIGRRLRRIGLVLLLFTAAKVLFFDMANLSGMVRVGSFIAVGLVTLAGALTARRLAKGA